MMNVYIFTCRQSAQRINYYNALSELCNLTVVAERRSPKDVIKAYGIDRIKYKTVSLRGIPLFGYMAFCPGVLNVLKSIDYNDSIIIIEQYATPTAMISINYLSRKKIPFIISADGGFVSNNENILKYKLKRFLISKASYWITSGENSINYLLHYGALSDRIRLFKFSPYKREDQPKHPITAEERQNAKNELGISEDIIVITVGRQVHGKGFDLLLKAMQNIEENVGLYIIGGEPNDECKEILKSTPMKNVHFPGLVDKSLLKKYYTAGDVFVFPTRSDVWGYPIIEALSFGLPIISSNRSNAGLELIKDEINGYIFDDGDVLKLQQKMKLLLSNRMKREKMSANNYRLSKDYTSESMAESIYKILTELEAQINSKVLDSYDNK